MAVVPSRGRPEAARATVAALRTTAALLSTRVVLAVDRSDPKLEAYRALRWPGEFGPEVSLVVLDDDETGDLVRATNTVSMRVAHADPNCVIGNLGDDHRPRTYAWDRAVLGALEAPGVAYGDDLLQSEALPTAPFISAAIPLALGWYALPSCRHLFIDNAWRDIGAQTGRLHYLPGVVIEHLHPAAGKALMDEGYERANGRAMVEHDKAAYNRWRAEHMAADIDNVRRALEAAA